MQHSGTLNRPSFSSWDFFFFLKRKTFFGANLAFPLQSFSTKWDDSPDSIHHYNYPADLSLSETDPTGGAVNDDPNGSYEQAIPTPKYADWLFMALSN